MKRSEINRYLRQAEKAFVQAGFALPPFARLPAGAWENLGHEYDEIRENMLGWDITDFGSGDFEKCGLLLLTMRNGKIGDPDSKTYAEKLMYVLEEQLTVLHFHWKKMEDIINRGGGNLICKLYNCTPDGNGFADTDVTVSSDGRNYTVPAGTEIRLTPGESITLLPGQFHSFWGEPGCGKVMLTEVSKVNDDNVDNHFYKPAGRFPAVEEDEKPLHLLATDYKK